MRTTRLFLLLSLLVAFLLVQGCDNPVGPCCKVCKTGKPWVIHA